MKLLYVCVDVTPKATNSVLKISRKIYVYIYYFTLVVAVLEGNRQALSICTHQESITQVPEAECNIARQFHR